MTPCSAACVGRFSRRPSSRSTCLRTSSGRSIAASCSRSSLASAADSSNSPSSSWIALSCWRRTNSRCVRSISDCTWLWISEPIEMTSSSRASTSVRRRRRRATLVSSSSACFCSVGSRSEPEMRWLSALGSSTLATAICSSSGRYGHRLDDLRERLLDVAHERRQLGRLLDDVGQLGDLGDEVGRLARPAVDAHALGALDEQAQRPVGHLEHPRDDADDADVVELVRAGLLELGLAAGDHDEHAVAGEHVVDELDRALLADRQRRQRVGERHRLAQRQDRQRRRQLPRDADLDLLRGAAVADDVDHESARRRSCGSAAEPPRSIGTLRARASTSASGSSTRRIPSW